MVGTVTPKAAKGLATGRVTDEQDRPLSNVTGYAGQVTFYNANVMGKTGVDGRYRLCLSARPGVYIVHGEMTRNPKAGSAMYWLLNVAAGVPWLKAINLPQNAFIINRNERFCPLQPKSYLLPSSA